MITILIAGLALLTAGALYASYYLLGPYIDNRLGLLTGRDLKHFLSYGIGKVPLGEVIVSRAGSCSWTARHDGFMWKTVIEALTNAGETLRWELSNAPPRPWLAKGIYVTPLGRAAALLVPELLPRGVSPQRVAVGHFAAGVIYDMAQPNEARKWLRPFMEKRGLVPSAEGEAGQHQRGRGPTTR